MQLAQARASLGKDACDLSPELPRPACPRVEAGVHQRVALLEGLAADLTGRRETLRLDLLPAALVLSALRHASARGGTRLQAYRVELVLCPDGEWRVRRHQAAGPTVHPVFELLAAPGLVPFLPGLCRHLLGAPLLLPSVPTLWLGEAQQHRIWSHAPAKWLLMHALRPERAPPGCDWPVTLLAAVYTCCWTDLQETMSMHC